MAWFQFGEAEETAIAQAGQNPALDDLDADFHFRFVPRFARPCRHDRGVVMDRHAGIGAVDLGIVQTGALSCMDAPGVAREKLT